MLSIVKGQLKNTAVFFIVFSSLAILMPASSGGDASDVSKTVLGYVKPSNVRPPEKSLFWNDEFKYDVSASYLTVKPVRDAKTGDIVIPSLIIVVPEEAFEANASERAGDVKRVLSNSLYYNELKEGDVFAVPGAGTGVYKIASVDIEKPTVTLEMLAEDVIDSLGVDAPRGPVVLFGPSVSSLNPFALTLEANDRGKKTAAFDLDVVEIRVSGSKVRRGNQKIRLAEGRFRAYKGAVLPIGGLGFKIVNVVLPDEKRQIAGWIELSKEPPIKLRP
ncbi:hypothetical protein [Stratiformator vulcanicus]|uniref:Uncharacterized protein n=1 Tax=Stratiformator vulcanicus TaxID=2527980 RepID=A0A517QVL1_9PLAN|nr:hypothetical protein [Stratiformator vulcanicus]QDT35696.1 hypothetical protein Pan189_00490 [Stratiformator vulcanicus]